MRDRLIMFLTDRHERIVPPVMDWWLTECDINKDIKVSHMLHFSGIKIQVKHLDHLFKVYVKPMGKDTVCRVDETKSFERKNPLEAIDSFTIQIKCLKIESMHCVRK